MKAEKKSNFHRLAQRTPLPLVEGESAEGEPCSQNGEAPAATSDKNLRPNYEEALHLVTGVTIAIHRRVQRVRGKETCNREYHVSIGLRQENKPFNEDILRSIC
jgi:hypothetical protein